jgi:tetratricopeptide (TPR) repeat protein
VTSLEELETSITALINQEMPPLVELRKALLDLEEIISSIDYQEFTAEQRNRIQDLRRDLKSRLRQGEEQPDLTPSAGENKTDGGSAAPASPADMTGSAESTPPQAAARPRNPLAEQLMEDAEKLFYGGRYAEAIRLFDRVLQLEPSWERPRQHRSESENYLRTGYIPPVALPAEAASAFGKAQSAARVGRFEDALTLLAKAQNVLRDLGIQRWQEGLEFEQKLQENIDAENAYLEGLHLFEQGKIDEAIERVETAARATGLPKYNDRAQAFQRIKEMMRSINETLSSPNIDPKMVTQAKADLDLLGAEHGENPALLRLRSRLETIIPRAISPLQDQARALKAQAERASTLEEALYLGKQAKAQLDQIRNLSGMNENLDRLQTEVDRLLREVARYEDELAQANASFENHRRWPAQAARISQEARQRYPNDPSVTRLNRSLASYFALRTMLKIGFVVAVIALLVLLGWLGYNRFKMYQLSLTPTPTSTPTITPTPTYTQTSTSTATITPTYTATFTLTPTPNAGTATRDIWARNGCYEGFTAVGRIPQGGYLRFLQSERRFDTFNRECVLVEYQGEGKSVIGWVLILDIGSPPTATPSP